MAPGVEYTIFTVGGMMVAGLMQSPPPQETMTSWMAHLLVEDLAGSLEKAKALGGKVHIEPQEVPDMGEFALIEDTTGAFINLFQANAPG